MSTLEVLGELLAREYHVPAERVVPEATLATLGLDSLAVIELMFKVEDAFSLKITEDPPGDLATVGAVVDYIDGLLAGRVHEAQPAA